MLLKFCLNEKAYLHGLNKLNFVRGKRGWASLLGTLPENDAQPFILSNASCKQNFSPA